MRAQIQKLTNWQFSSVRFKVCSDSDRRWRNFIKTNVNFRLPCMLKTNHWLLVRLSFVAGPGGPIVVINPKFRGLAWPELAATKKKTMFPGNAWQWQAHFGSAHASCTHADTGNKPKSFQHRSPAATCAMITTATPKISSASFVSCISLEHVHRSTGRAAPNPSVCTHKTYACSWWFNNVW